MAKKRPGRASEPEPKRPNRSGISLHVYVDPVIDAALQRYLDSAVPAVSKTAAVEAAIIDFLRARGCWPANPSTPE
jgi:hypothetical protein